jgi:transcriptional regulator with XRE-family HTH domain
MAGVLDSSKVAQGIFPTKQVMNLKNQLKALLVHRNMTAAELSRKSGVSKQVLSLWLGGAKPKNVDQIKSVSDALSVTVDHLLFGNSEINREKPGDGLHALLGDDWISGAFEIKLRRIKK